MTQIHSRSRPIPTAAAGRIPSAKGPATPNFKSESPESHERSPFKSGAVEPAPNYLTAPQADPQLTAQPAAPQEGTIHRFSFVKGFFSFISVMGALGSFDSGDILFGLGFGLPGAWYFIKSIQQKTNPTEPQKRHWFVIWLIAILLVIIG